MSRAGTKEFCGLIHAEICPEPFSPDRRITLKLPKE